MIAEKIFDSLFVVVIMFWSIMMLQSYRMIYIFGKKNPENGENKIPNIFSEYMNPEKFFFFFRKENIVFLKKDNEVWRLRQQARLWLIISLMVSLLFLVGTVWLMINGSTPERFSSFETMFFGLTAMSWGATRIQYYRLFDYFGEKQSDTKKYMNLKNFLFFFKNENIPVFQNNKAVLKLHQQAKISLIFSLTLSMFVLFFVTSFIFDCILLISMTIWVLLVIQFHRLLYVFIKKYPEIAKRKRLDRVFIYSDPEKSLFFFKKKNFPLLRSDREIWGLRQQAKILLIFSFGFPFLATAFVSLFIFW